MDATMWSPGETPPIVTAGSGKSSSQAVYDVTPFCVTCAVPVWMMLAGELGPPSIPIQVAEAPVFCVGWIVGTIHFPDTLVNVDPPAIWPDQLVDFEV